MLPHTIRIFSTVYKRVPASKPSARQRAMTAFLAPKSSFTYKKTIYQALKLMIKDLLISLRLKAPPLRSRLFYYARHIKHHNSKAVVLRDVDYLDSRFGTIYYGKFVNEREPTVLAPRVEQISFNDFKLNFKKGYCAWVHPTIFEQLQVLRYKLFPIKPIKSARDRAISKLTQ